MTLRAVIDKAEDVPEALKDEYVEKGGKWYLDLDGTLNTHTAIVPLANSLANAKREKQTLQGRVTELESKVAGLPDDFDPAKYADVVAELDALKADPNRDKDVEARLTKAREGYEQRLRDADKKRNDDVAAKDREIAERDGYIGSLLIDGGLTDALVKHGVAPEFTDATKALLRGKVKVEKNDEGKRVAVVDTDMGKVDIDHFVEHWSKSDAGKPFVKPAKGGGAEGDRHKGGGGDHGEVNPWDTKTKNITRQGAIVKEDKEKARRMMRAAKVSEARIAETLNSL